MTPASRNIAEEASLTWAAWTEEADGPPKLGGKGQASGSEVISLEEEKEGGLPPGAAPRRGAYNRVHLEPATAVKAGSPAASASSEEPRTKTVRKGEQEQVPKAQPVAGLASSTKGAASKGKSGKRWHELEWRKNSEAEKKLGGIWDLRAFVGQNLFQDY